MGCEHVGPPQVIEMAESYLAERDVPAERWEGYSFAFKENKEHWGAKAFHTVVVRRDGAWVTTKIDRLPEPLPEGELGLSASAP